MLEVPGQDWMGALCALPKSSDIPLVAEVLSHSNGIRQIQHRMPPSGGDKNNLPRLLEELDGSKLFWPLLSACNLPPGDKPLCCRVGCFHSGFPQERQRRGRREQHPELPSRDQRVPGGGAQRVFVQRAPRAAGAKQQPAVGRPKVREIRQEVLALKAWRQRFWAAKG